MLPANRIKSKLSLQLVWCSRYPSPTESGRISMELVERLPRSKGYDTVLVLVDCLSKYAHFLALGHPFSVKTVTVVFVKEVVRLHGYPYPLCQIMIEFY